MDRVICSRETRTPSDEIDDATWTWTTKIVSLKSFLAAEHDRAKAEIRVFVTNLPFIGVCLHRLVRSGHRGRLREESCHAKTEAPSARCGRLDGLIRHDMTDQFTTSSVNQALFPGQISAIFLSFPQSSHESTRRRCVARGVTLYNRG